MENDWGKLAVKVSLYRGYDDPVPMRSVFLPDFITLTNDRLNSCLRCVREAKDKLVAKRIKRSLPAITVSGEFRKRCVDGLIRHSGLMCLDFDGCPVAKAKHELSKLSYVAFAAESASGKGVFAIIPISRTDMHREHFEALKDEMNNIGLEVDKACNDVCRLRGFSHDPKFYCNPHADTWTRVKVLPNLCSGIVSYSRGSDEDRFIRLLELIEGMQIDITSDRKDWIKIGMAISSTFGESGRGYFHRLSKFYPKYKPFITDKQYSSFLRGGYRNASISSVFWIAKRYGAVLNG